MEAELAKIWDQVRANENNITGLKRDFVWLRDWVETRDENFDKRMAEFMTEQKATAGRVETALNKLAVRDGSDNSVKEIFRTWLPTIFAGGMLVIALWKQ